MKTFLTFIWRFLVGALFTLTPISAILVVGWTQRATARSVARNWHARAGYAKSDFPAFAQQEPETAGLANWPRWIMADNASALFAEARKSGLWRGAALMLRALFGSLLLNTKAGLSALLPIAIVALPASLLLLLSWWGGWENSFNKGYEQAWVGPVVAFAGIFYFILAMTLLPLAEVRQAVNGSWRAFFDVSFLRRAAREVRVGLIGLAVLFVTAGFIVAMLKIAPMAIGNSVVMPADLERLRAGYPLLVAAVLFPLYVAMRLAAGRVYARAALRLVAKDGGGNGLADRERSLLARLSLQAGGAKTKRGVIARVAAGSGAAMAGATSTAIVLALWAGFVGEIYLSQFLAHDWLSWINHPLVQLPWTGGIFR